MRINELRLAAHDLAAQQAFYSGVLGLPTAISGEALAVRLGDSQLTFVPAPDRAGVYHFAFNIPQNQFEEARRWLAARRPLLRSAAGEETFAFASWNAHALYFQDPAGNIVEFIARHNLDNSAEAPFTAGGLLCISEIGIATDDVRATVGELQAGLGLAVYSGAGSDTFTAVGDEDGLLIVVQRGRLWFPDTGIPADLLPLAVTLTAGEQSAVLSGPPYDLTPAA